MFNILGDKIRHFILLSELVWRSCVSVNKYKISAILQARIEEFQINQYGNEREREVNWLVFKATVMISCHIFLLVEQRAFIDGFVELFLVFPSI